MRHAPGSGLVMEIYRGFDVVAGGLKIRIRHGLLLLVPCLWDGLCRSGGPAMGGPGVGDPAPLLQAKGLLQSPPETRLDAQTLRGRVVVLEFLGHMVRSLCGRHPASE